MHNTYAPAPSGRRRFRRILVALLLCPVVAGAAVVAEAAYSASSPDPDRLLLITPAFAHGSDWRGSSHPATDQLAAEVGWGNREGVVVNVTVARHGWDLPTRWLSAGLRVPVGGHDAEGNDAHQLRDARLRAAAPGADEVSGVASSCSATDHCRRYDFELRYRGTLLRVVAFNSRDRTAGLDQALVLGYLHDLDADIG